MAKKKYKKELLKTLKVLGNTERKLLENMTQLMFLEEFKKNNIELRKGDKITFKDDIFDYSEDKNIRKLAKLRREILQSMKNILDKNDFKDKDLEFLA